MAIWSVLFLEHWKRTEKNTAMKWGTIGFEQGEVERPQFVGECTVWRSDTPSVNGCFTGALTVIVPLGFAEGTTSTVIC
jgi:hypothetical protein